jgi:hypothetical protein
MELHHNHLEKDVHNEVILLVGFRCEALVEELHVGDVQQMMR